MRIRIRDRNLFDPGSGMQKLGSGINFLDPQRWCSLLQSRISHIVRSLQLAFVNSAHIQYVVTKIYQIFFNLYFGCFWRFLYRSRIRIRSTVQSIGSAPLYALCCAGTGCTVVSFTLQYIRLDCAMCMRIWRMRGSICLANPHTASPYQELCPAHQSHNYSIVLHIFQASMCWRRWRMRGRICWATPHPRNLSFSRAVSYPPGPNSLSSPFSAAVLRKVREISGKADGQFDIFFNFWGTWWIFYFFCSWFQCCWSEIFLLNPGSWFFLHPRTWIPDLRSCIQQQQKEDRKK